MGERQIAIGIDVGGSAIKAGAVDLESGRLVAERIQVDTPHPSTPAAVVEQIVDLVNRVSAGDAPNAPVGVTVPSVVIDGVSHTAANIDAGWIGFDAEAALEKALGRDVVVLNDADAAGLAEMRFGAGRGRNGVVLMLTLGTGVGSALFVDGKLVPNTELGHMEIRGMDAEKRSAAIARVRDNESWERWAADLDEHLTAIDRILWPSLIILGGGVSHEDEKFVPLLSIRPPIVPAGLENDAGIVGAAMAAAERTAPA
ncbi:MAG TPA: ROK family protein [Candidatus Limnocylindrales bacterium]|nr:ROK family protein [Candidatus Limnocylindrales bacterium]